MAENLINNPFLYSLSLTLLHFIWQGFLVALTLKSALLFVSHQKPQVRYLMSSLAMLANLVLPFITFFIIYTPNYLALTHQTSTNEFLSVALYSEQISQSQWYSAFIEYLPYVSIAWMATVSVLAIKLLLEVYAVNQLSKVSIVPTQIELQVRFEQLCTKFNMLSPPKLLISLKTDVPMAIGWLKPVVLIPASMLSGLTPAQLDMLILHELAHIRRHDYLVNFLQTLVEILLFFHPAVMWVSNQMRNEREYCSDDMAVSVSGDAIAYAHTLTDTAVHCQKHRHHAIPGMAMAASGGDLKQRVLRLVDHQHHCASVDNSSKWIAPLLVVLTVAWAFKSFITLPIIDVTTGNIVLTHFSDHKPQVLPQNNQDSVLPKTSLATQLLTKDDETKLKEVSVKAPQKIVSKSAPTSTLTQTKIKTANIITTKPATKSVFNERKQKPIKVANQTQRTSKVEQILTSTTNASAIEEKLNIAKTVVSKTFANPYASAVASLNQINDDIELQQPTRQHIYSTSSSAATKLAAQITSNDNFQQEAKLVASMPPKYPATAKRRGIELDVTVNFTIDRTGKVQNIKFNSKGKVSYFRSAIRNTLEQWRFLPATIDGKPVESEMSKIFSFSLES